MIMLPKTKYMNNFKIFSSIIFPFHLLFDMHCKNFNSSERQDGCTEEEDPSSNTLCQFNHKPAKIYEQADSDSAEDKTEYCQHDKKSQIWDLHFSPLFTINIRINTIYIKNATAIPSTTHPITYQNAAEKISRIRRMPGRNSSQKQDLFFIHSPPFFVVQKSQYGIK